VTQKPHNGVITVFPTNYEPFGVQSAAIGTNPTYDCRPTVSPRPFEESCAARKPFESVAL